MYIESSHYDFIIVYCNPSPDRGVGSPEELRPLTRKELAKVSNAVEVFGMDQVTFKLLFTVQCKCMCVDGPVQSLQPNTEHDILV